MTVFGRSPVYRGLASLGAITRATLSRSRPLLPRRSCPPSLEASPQALRCRRDACRHRQRVCLHANRADLLDRSYEVATARVPEAPGARRKKARSPKPILQGHSSATWSSSRLWGAALPCGDGASSPALVHAGRAEGSLPPAELGFEGLESPGGATLRARGKWTCTWSSCANGFRRLAHSDARAQAMAEEAQAMLAELSSEERIVAERAANAFADYVQAFAEKRLQERQLALLAMHGAGVRLLHHGWLRIAEGCPHRCGGHKGAASTGAHRR